MAGTRFVPAAAAQLPHRNTRRTLRVWSARIRGSRALPDVARERDEDRDARRAALAAHFRSSGAINQGRIRLLRVDVGMHRVHHGRMGGKASSSYVPPKEVRYETA